MNTVLAGAPATFVPGNSTTTAQELFVTRLSQSRSAVLPSWQARPLGLIERETDDLEDQRVARPVIAGRTGVEGDGDQLLRGYERLVDRPWSANRIGSWTHGARRCRCRWCRGKPDDSHSHGDD